MKVGTCVLNWKRPDQLKKIIPQLKNQTVEPKVWLWNNNSECVNDDFGAHERIDSSVNLECWPRWTVMAMMDTDVVFTWDDDLIPESNDVIERALANLVDLPNDGIVGTHGVKGISRGYWDAKHIHNPNQNHQADIIKGRFMMLRTDHLKDVSLEPSYTTDDIKLSSTSKNKLIIGNLGDDIQDMEERDVALWKKEWQKERRTKASSKYFKV